MAWLAGVASSVGSFLASNAGSIASLAAAGISAYGTAQEGQQQKKAARAEAAQLEDVANNQRAVAQLEAARRRKAGASQLSTQQSLLASSGFAADDPTSASLVSQTVGAQTLEELLTLAQGEDQAKQTEFQAAQVRAGGRNAAANARVSAFAGLANSGMSWYDRWGASRRAAKPKTTGGTLGPALESGGFAVARG